MMRKRKTKRRIQKVYTKLDIPKDGTYPTYKDVDLLEKFMTERGKIIPRSRTGVPSKYQRHVTRAIKQARHVALLPYIARV